MGFNQSSLLSAVLGELPPDSGMLKVKGQLTYASQQPWVFPGTIRSNILFGRELNRKKYEGVLKACALKKVRQNTAAAGTNTCFIVGVLIKSPSVLSSGPGAPSRWRSDSDRGQRGHTERRTESSSQPGQV